MPPRKKKVNKTTGEITEGKGSAPYDSGLIAGLFGFEDVGEAQVTTEYRDFEGVSTGSLEADYALGGGRGIPRGAITQFAGEPRSGKTTLALLTGITAVTNQLKVVIMSMEYRWNVPYAYNSGMGTPNKDYVLMSPRSGEDTLNYIVYFAEQDYDVCVVDSAAAMSTRNEKNSEVGDTGTAYGSGGMAKLWSEFFRMRIDKIAGSPMAIIIINQLRTKMNVMYGSPISRPGGRALEYYSSVIADIKNPEFNYLTESDHKERLNPVGFIMKGEVWKNSVAPPYRSLQPQFRFDHGKLEFGISEEAAKFGKDFGIFRGKGGGEISGGSQWWFDGRMIGESQAKVIEVLMEQPELRDEIIRCVREVMKG